MKKILFLALPLLMAGVVFAQTATTSAPATKPAATAAKPPAKPESTTQPKPRDPKWVQRHEGYVELAKKGNIDVYFEGDSITDGWHGGGKAIWDKEFAPLKAANFGISGDRTQHVLWRLENGELDGVNPKVVVLMIGTNNIGSNTPEQVADGVKAIIETFHTKAPNAKILLLAIFPRSAAAADPIRMKNEAANKILATFDNGKNVKYLSINDKFLDKEGNLSKEIMPDLLHPNGKGYQIWADAIREPLKELLGK